MRPTGLDDATMAAFARWTNLSETTFLLPPTDPAGRLPRAHLHARRRAALCRPPHAGQLPRLAGGRRPAAPSGVVVQECGVGLVRIRRQGSALAFAAPPLRRSGPLDADAAGRIAARAGCGRAECCSTSGSTTARAGAR
jgi:predicted PhzF superfamily epimerase YddE/YHI9